MKQTTKRFYGSIATVAFVSGLTGAFAFNMVNKKQVAGEQPSVPSFAEVFTGQQSTPAPSAPVVAGQPVDLTVAAEKACNSVVYIKVVSGGKTETVEYRDPFQDFFGDFFGRGGGTQRRQIQTPKRESAGSGVIISNDGYIVTNNHVVQQADNITITLNDNREFKAKVVGTDPDTDLALLKIDGKSLPALPIGDSDALKVGEWVLAVGNPFNLTSTVTAGIVSAKARNLGANQSGIESFIQTDAAINAGNSGGALVNVKGELVGINAMLYSQTGSFTGYGFAIPVSIMKKVVADIKTYGQVQRALLGIKGSTLHDYIDAQKAQNENYDHDFGTVDGVYVAEVPEDGAAAEAGLKTGDVIVAMDGKKITKMSELQEVTTRFRPGDKANITYIRDKKEKVTVITFRNAKGKTTVTKTMNMDVLGATFAEVPEGLRRNLGIQGGLLVKEVRSGKFKDAGITKDMIILKVNGQNIKSESDLEMAFKQAQTTDDRTMWIWGKALDGTAVSKAVQLGDE